MRGYTVNELIEALEDFRSIVDGGGDALVITDEYTIVGDLDIMLAKLNISNEKKLFCVLYYADLDKVSIKPYSFEMTIEDGEVEYFA